ncbi:MAG: hypothetical protein IJS41_03840 [Clostridia bacterium]|nr:hypothetical protein [Clostridia bacterium]
MKPFKEIIAGDVHGVFLNPDEFSDIQTIVFKGKVMEIPVQEDTNEQIEREKRMHQNADGLYVNQKLIYVAASDFGPMPKQGSLLTYRGRDYRVADAADEYGIYSITLEENRA